MSEENQTYGFVAWDDLKFPSKDGKKNYENKDSDYFKLEAGVNTVRILTSPAPYSFHNWKPEGESVDPKKASKWGYTVRCSKMHGSCPLCKAGNKPKQKFLMAVLVKEVEAKPDHKDKGKIKLLDASPAIAKDLKTLNDNKKWGNPFRYDVDIVKNPDADPNNYYSVTPSGPPEPLSDSEMKLKADWDDKMLTRHLVIPTPAQAEEQMERIMKKVAVEGGAPVKAKPTDGDDDFPSVD